MCRVVSFPRNITGNPESPQNPVIVANEAVGARLHNNAASIMDVLGQLEFGAVILPQMGKIIASFRCTSKKQSFGCTLYGVVFTDVIKRHLTFLDRSRSCVQVFRRSRGFSVPTVTVPESFPDRVQPLQRGHDASA